MRHTLLLFVSATAIIAAVPAMAAEIDASSQVDAVTVYPDGATVTRLIRLDLPAGDSTLLAKDFPLTLDPSSLRVQGEGGARVVIGAVEARQPLPQPAANTPEIDRKLETLRDDRTPQVCRAVCRYGAGRTWRERRGKASQRMACGFRRGR
jgi:hypothetical protein